VLVEDIIHHRGDLRFLTHIDVHAVPPSARCHCLRSSPARGPHHDMRRPLLAKRSHSALPMPLPPPVTTTTLSFICIF
jgi:hypothetical protein